MSRPMKLLLAVWIALLVGGAGWVAWDIARQGNDGLPGAASIGGAFALTDQDGRTVSEADFRGRLTLYYFGFTHCPDACPTALLQVLTAFEKLGAQAEGKVQAVFVTVDPERDTAAVMKQYVESFGPQFIGLTGTAEQIAAAAKSFRVFYRKVPGKDGDYTMDHSSVIYLMDRRGRYLQGFTHNSRAEDIAAAIAKQL
jgi:protein SCO1